ncbi:MAG TPA: folylpolyglutamate synthase/dihydrofolate synthase family protein [Planctomycetota bacterium]|jgi:dihydrofolate synthase/folylpolyglutamate synthase|nr:folylpolyglutamate synthase/dihydrofolate synthase family protein [Planctomycetota bacterium]
MFRTYRQALDHLAKFTDYERMQARYAPDTYNLDRMRRLVEALGHPERTFPSLHIAGTKGKGSVAHMAEAVLREAGFRTGLYTSPHLVDMRERIRRDGRPMTERDFVWAMNRMERPLRRLRPTYFETMTAAAFLLFARWKVDWAVIEVGLGGRLDATNVIRPAACAITPIDYDHMDKLGRTLGAIAREKAGILKPGVPAVSSPQRPAAWRELRRHGRLFVPRVRLLSRRPGRLEFEVEGLRGKVYRCALPAWGVHQAGNAGTALALLEAAGVPFTRAQARRALARLRLPGRVEVVRRRPWIVVDTAHNPVAARALEAALRDLPRRRTVLVFGASADKDYVAMLRTLLPGTDLAIFTRARSPRAADPRELARHARNIPALRADSVERALEAARAIAGPRDAVVVTGSFYVAGEALERLGKEA